MNARNKSAAIGKILALIRKNKKFVVIAHECPDGDSLGSALAMACVLRKLKKDVRIMTDMVPEKYAYLPFTKEITSTPPADLSDRVGMLFDTPTLDRLGCLKSPVTRCQTLVNIDHHVSNTLYGGINWVETSAASVGEQVYDLLKKLRVKLDKNIATCLYTSIVTDTGKFQYTNTTPETHRITAELMETGINHQRITEKIYEDYPEAKLRLLAEVLRGVRRECAGKVAWVKITKDLLAEAGTTLEWADDVINYARGIRGVEVAIVFKESDEAGVYKISFRSRNPAVDVNAVAREFSGGGHKAASGCTLKGSLEEVTQKVLAEVKKIYGAS